MSNLDALLITPPSRIDVYQDLSNDYAAIEPPVWSMLIAKYLTTHNYNVENLNRIYSEVYFESFSDLLRTNHWNIHRINLSTVSNERYNWVGKLE